MKKILIITILLLLLAGCTDKGTVTSGETATTSKWEVNSNVEGMFVEPGYKIELSISEKGKDQVTQVDKVILEVNNKDLAIINEDGSITVNNDALSGMELEIKVKFKDLSTNLGYTVLKPLGTTVDENNRILNESDYDVVVNKKRFLSSDYVPKDLVKVNVPTQLENPEVNQMRKIPADRLHELFEGAKKEGFTLIARSGYRSYNTQDILYRNVVTSKGQTYADKYSAKPGTSEHQTGLAMDITSEGVNFQLSEDFGELPESIWVKENAHKYGFIIRYPKDKEEIVGYAYEPWHIRYVGVELATKIYKSGLTMEEYFEKAY